MSDIQDKARRLADQLKAGESVSVESDALADELVSVLSDSPAQADAVEEAVAEAAVMPSPENPVTVQPVPDGGPTFETEPGPRPQPGPIPIIEPDPKPKDGEHLPYPVDPPPSVSADPNLPAPPADQPQSPSASQIATAEAVAAGDTTLRSETPPSLPPETALGASMQKVRAELVTVRDNIDKEIARIDKSLFVA